MMNWLVRSEKWLECRVQKWAVFGQMFWMCFETNVRTDARLMDERRSGSWNKSGVSQLKRWRTAYFTSHSEAIYWCWPSLYSKDLVEAFFLAYALGQRACSIYVSIEMSVAAHHLLVGIMLSCRNHLDHSTVNVRSWNTSLTWRRQCCKLCH